MTDAKESTPSEREEFPNAPLQFVAWEIRTPSIPRFQSPSGVVESMSGRLQDLTPIVAQPEASVVLDVAQQQGPRAEPRQRMLDRKQMLSISMGPTATLIETTAYTMFEDFVDVVGRVVRAIESAEVASGFERIGLRYIDEIRVPGVVDPTGWPGYINEALLTGLGLSDSKIVSTQNLTEYRRDHNFNVTMRSGAVDGRTVDASGPLRLPRVGDGHYFLLDIDSYWAKPSDDPIPEFTAEEVLRITNRLRQPVRELFEQSVTERLRDEIFRKET